MAETGRAFNEIAPMTTLTVPINYVAIPYPSVDDGATVVVSVLPNQLEITYED